MHEVTRRDFFKTTGTVGAALAGGAAAASTAFAEEPASESVAPSFYDITVHDTEILIIGGGLAGCMAARAAFGEGATDLTVLDKGPWGHSGTSGINWGHDTETFEFGEEGAAGSTAVYIWEIANSGMADQDYIYAIGEALNEYRAVASAEQMGGLVHRISDGRAGYSQRHEEVPQGNPGDEPVGLAVNHGYFNRYACQWVKRQGAKIHDWTEVLDLLYAADGSIAGAVAINRKDGSPHMFRAKAVVMATGSYVYVVGWNGMGARSISGPEATGDSRYWLMKHGVPMIDMEFQPCDFVQWTPAAIRQGMGAMGGSITNYKDIYDADGNCICLDERFADGFLSSFYNNAEFMACCFAAIYDGKGGPNGDVIADMDVTENLPNNPYYQACRLRAAMLGYEDPQFVELCPEQWETGGHPLDLTTESEVVGIPGLFTSSSAAGGVCGMAFASSYGTGLMAGRGAVRYANTLNAAPEVDMADARAILDEAYALLDAEPADPIRSLDVQRMIQNAYWQGMGIFRNEEGLKAAVAELDRIEAEVLPHMYVPSKSKTMNSDWWKAIEARAMLMCAKATGLASMARKESRGCFCRDDYPAEDNVNFLKSVAVTFKDGEWTVELSDKKNTMEPLEDIIARLPALGFPIKR